MSSHTISATNGAGTTGPLAVTGYATERQSRNIIHDVLDGGIAVSFVPLRPRSGTLVTVYDNRADAWAAYELYASSDTFTYVNAELPEVSMTFALDGRLSIEPDEEITGIWYVDVSYQEVN